LSCFASCSNREREIKQLRRAVDRDSPYQAVRLRINDTWVLSDHEASVPAGKEIRFAGASQITAEKDADPSVLRAKFLYQIREVRLNAAGSESVFGSGTVEVTDQADGRVYFQGTITAPQTNARKNAIAPGYELVISDNKHQVVASCRIHVIEP
jgi:hypothetical protein